MKRKASFALILAMLILLLPGCRNKPPAQTEPDTDAPAQTEQAFEPFLQFIAPKDALADMKSTPVGTDAWQICYAGPSFVYLTYNFGTSYIFRYSAGRNRIDMALDTRGLFPAETSGPRSANCAFSADGRYAVLIPGFAPEDRPPQNPVYKIDFIADEITVLADDSRDFSMPPEFSYYDYEKTFADQREYLEMMGVSPELPELYGAGWCVVAKLNEELYFLIRPNDPEDASPGPGYYYYKIDVVNMTQGKSVQEFRLDSVK